MDTLAAVLLLVGSAFMLIAAIGVTRLPDTFTRMQAATKGGAVGLSFVMLALAVELARVGPSMRAMLAVLFVILTAPVAAQVIARAAYLGGVQLWEGTTRDDLRGSGDVERIVEEESEEPAGGRA
ncbi:MAG: monovalent cation/H(+) antiporter subunit G [Sandaracinaceae bacterium]|nr:monovalent cation/H(+) antiporter subunit G [Sandaracinaceae bacterium]